jgi:outer membrane protein assembly factor BamE (lipoprotein component of BamABCDE complex)
VLPRGYVMRHADASRKMRVPGLGSSINRHRRTALAIAFALTGAAALGGCARLGTTETLARGYVLPTGALEQIPIGASQEQVLIVLGTPSTVATINGDVFYYISQKSQRKAAFMPYDVVDQRVVGVYFDKDKRVVRLANYGLKDGKIFDFVSGKTETGGQNLNYLRGIFKNVGFNPFGG